MLHASYCVVQIYVVIHFCDSLEKKVCL